MLENYTSASLPSASLPSASLPSASLPSASLPSVSLSILDVTHQPPSTSRCGREYPFTIILNTHSGTSSHTNSSVICLVFRYLFSIPLSV